jgi:membrane-bound lytic murein transglycosylase D
LVPVAQAKTFKKNLAMLPYWERVAIKSYDDERVAEPSYYQEKHQERVAQTRQQMARTTLAQYKVKSGENRVSIINRNRTTNQPFRQVNYLAGNSVRKSTNFQIASAAKSNNIQLLARASKTKSANTQVYAIKKGDTFFNISKRFSVTPKDIANWNNITLKTALIPGRKLSIKSVNPQLASASSSIRLINYKVGKGDTLTQISRKFNVSVSDLKKSNAATLVRGLQTGQKLKVIVDSSQSSS